jgi:serine/threonine-protein kinase
VAAFRSESPRVIGRYVLHDRIASGGMAAVHLGRLVGPAGFSRTVAIKRLHPQFAQDPDFVAMLLDEARLVARIRHPNVVPTLDVNVTDGELFLVMEYVQGEALSALLRSSALRGERIPPGLATTILAGVLHGLHAAHEARGERNEPLGIVHRDVSPQNVLVGVDGVARVLDFGIAKAAGRAQTTREGQLKGKIAYMAPEQLDGVTSAATDIYAASAVLWETLTLRRLFAGESDPAVLKMVLDGRIEPPSRQAPGIPPELDAIVLRGLSAKPEDRFPTAEEMAVALENVLPAVPASRLGAWVRLTATDALTNRSQRIAAIEISSHGEVVSPPISLAEVPAPPVSGARPLTEELPTQLTTGISKRDLSLVTRPRRMLRRVAWTVGAAAVSLGLLALAGRALTRTPSAGAAASAPEPPTHLAPVPPVPARPSESAPLAEEPPASTRAAAPASSAAPEASTRPVDRSPSRVVRPAPVRKPSAATPACVPPYYFDAEGNRVFKKECL